MLAPGLGLRGVGSRLESAPSARGQAGRPTPHLLMNYELTFFAAAQRFLCAAAILARPSGLIRCFFCGERAATPAGAAPRPPKRRFSSAILALITSNCCW